MTCFLLKEFKNLIFKLYTFFKIGIQTKISNDAKKIAYSLPKLIAIILVKYPPKIPPAIAPAPINPKFLFAYLALKTMFSNSQNCDVATTANKEINT